MKKEDATITFVTSQNDLSTTKIRCNWQVLFRDAVILFLFTLLVRLPYFVPTVIHWHESTYILLGQDILNGHLPQTFYSELKPPAAGVPYALLFCCSGSQLLPLE